MLVNIHFFNIKAGADEKRMLHLLDKDLAEYAKTFGCIERKTWKRLDAYSYSPGQPAQPAQPAQSAAYINVSLWPSKKEADAYTRAAREPPDEFKKVLVELFSGIEFEKTVRYVDEQG